MTTEAQKKQPTATKQHFELVARVISTRITPQDREALASVFADEFESTNENFDRVRFMAAANPDETGTSA